MEISAFPFANQEDYPNIFNFFQDFDNSISFPSNKKRSREEEEEESDDSLNKSLLKELLGSLLLLEGEDEKSDQEDWSIESQLHKSGLDDIYNLKRQAMDEYYNHLQSHSDDLNEIKQGRLKRAHQEAAETATSFAFSHVAPLNESSSSTAVDSGSGNGKGQQHRRLWVKNRSKAWWEQCISPDFPEEEFKKAFRMSKATFNIICEELEPVVTKKDTMLRSAIPVRQRVAVCIWRLATGEPLRLVSKRFGLGISTCHKLVLEVCSAIKSLLMSKFVKWPEEDKLQEIKEQFELISGIPNVGGSMYTTHIPIIAPKISVSAYYNKRHTERNQKTSYSVTLQGVVDHNGVFTDVCIGWPGSMSDDKVLEKSALYQRANSGQLKDVWIVGNSGYPLTDWVLVPYTHQNRTWTQHAFNEKIGELQNVAKESFMRLKGRWTCLQRRTEVKLQDLPVVLGACCVLHNICEMRNEEMDPELRFDLVDDEVVPENSIRSTTSMQARDHIAHNLLHHSLAGTGFL